jgi:acetyl esterase/lipase
MAKKIRLATVANGLLKGILKMKGQHFFYVGLGVLLLALLGACAQSPIAEPEPDQLAPVEVVAPQTEEKPLRGEAEAATGSAFYAANPELLKAHPPTLVEAMPESIFLATNPELMIARRYVAVESEVDPDQDIGLLEFLRPQASLVTPDGRATVAPTQEIEPQTNVVYGVVAGESLLLDIYQPVAGEAPRPTVIVIHGGAGSYGDRSDLSEHAQALARAGYVAFNIEYRLLDGGKNPWPAQLADVQLAVRWVRANAAQYNVDPNRIAALGHSFGGQLAALLGMRDTPDSSDLPLTAYSSRVACVVDIAGSVDPTQPLEDIGAGLDVQLMGGTASEVPARYRDASPLAQVSAETVPFLIFHGGDDEVVPVEESRRLVDALHKAGVTVVYIEYPHATHFYWLNFFNPGGWESVGPETLAFLGRCLHTEAAEK